MVSVFDMDFVYDSIRACEAEVCEIVSADIAVADNLMAEYFRSTVIVFTSGMRDGSTVATLSASDSDPPADPEHAYIANCKAQIAANMGFRLTFSMIIES